MCISLLKARQSSHGKDNHLIVFNLYVAKLT